MCCRLGLILFVMIAIDPFVMYFLEFEYHLDKDDLSYIYQGLAPRNSKNMTLNTRKVAHKLDPAELLSAKDVLDPTLRWMVFKVKQRSMAAYEDLDRTSSRADH